ncbi:MAG: type II toxin-antitoxin system death-on-curing family toxin [Alphaproteobacteria bacterium]|nr:type II toxin-antitoxin system death-on-curing family toxin [Alphaproteobacteria bacterium]
MKGELVHLNVSAVLAVHREVLAAHGGGSGIREQTLLESAVAAPQATYGGVPVMSDPVEVAAAYLFYICRNHPFVDGNKRTALAACLVFMERNGLLGTGDAGLGDIDAWEALVLDVAASRIDRDATTARLRALVRPPRRRKTRAVPRDR